MILVDTGIIIYIRTVDLKLDRLFKSTPVAVCGVVRAELLHGVRSASDRANVLAILAPFQHIPMTEAVWDAVGDNLQILRGSGVSVPFQDAVLASISIYNGLELWTRDNHFTLIQQVIPTLLLFSEPP